MNPKRKQDLLEFAEAVYKALDNFVNMMRANPDVEKKLDDAIKQDIQNQGMYEKSKQNETKE